MPSVKHRLKTPINQSIDLHKMVNENKNKVINPPGIGDIMLDIGEIKITTPNRGETREWRPLR